MSRRSHHRSSINIHELAEALTQRGWQPPNPQNTMTGQHLPMQPMSGNSTMNNSLSALSGLLGAVNGGNMPQGSNQPAMPGNMPQIQGSFPPIQGMMPMRQPPQSSPSRQPSEYDLLKALFQQTLRTLKNE